MPILPINMELQKARQIKTQQTMKREQLKTVTRACLILQHNLKSSISIMIQTT